MKQRRLVASNYFSFAILLVLLIALPLLYYAAQTLQQLTGRAAGKKANIIVDLTKTQGPLAATWRSFAQGGEESKDMIAPVIGQVRALNPEYIRIDHIFDHFEVVSRNANGQLVFDFSSLDRAVDSILATGAKPFLSLSYMPAALSSGDVTAPPRDWNEWQLLIQRTVEHYSGRNAKNLSGIYYEVWNEPDLFGNWKYYGDKSYLTLYSYSAKGAAAAQNTNQFYIGGPATTGLYKNWITALANFTSANNLRIDFFSWHRYHTDPGQYTKDIGEVTDWLFFYPRLIQLPRVISEWGFDSNNNAGYDGLLGAAHTAATIRQLGQGYQQMLSFELVDGPDPAGQTYWGRWGLLTHPSKGSIQKPRYRVFQFLNLLGGQRLLVQGEGSWVQGLAYQNDQKTQVFLVNYDINGRNTEDVPVTIENIAPGNYTVKITRLTQAATQTQITTSETKLTTSVIMSPNQVVLLEISPAL